MSFLLLRVHRPSSPFLQIRRFTMAEGILSFGIQLYTTTICDVGLWTFTIRNVNTPTLTSRLAPPYWQFLFNFSAQFFTMLRTGSRQVLDNHPKVRKPRSPLLHVWFWYARRTRHPQPILPSDSIVDISGRVVVVAKRSHTLSVWAIEKERGLQRPTRASMNAD
ncbi:hypothetical protein BT96DRAFT_995753 [Gymnopus androsaceus JB14]|uniref:Uncharacterized protein n=1 Tax=Gymnopus androsaceus JB14 TaxID=1447944 RepID=A0A6A4HIM3_9AGAR|nr:hypothetical protein BT96DRAFT_995753 [Gymnopus androsaceus JB14]